MNQDTLLEENREYDGTHGVSHMCRGRGFQPAFRDEETGRVELSRQRNGEPAPIHVISWLPREWAATVGASGAILSLKPGVTSGFVCKDIFYTRDEAAGHCTDRAQQDNRAPDQP